MIVRRAMPFRWLAAWLCAVLLLGSSSVAWTAPRKDEGKELADEAAERFKSQLFVEAAELFERAYALNPEKVVRLRNAGRAWEEAGRLDQARHLFRRYVELVPEGADRNEVRLRLARIEARLAPPPEPAPAAKVVEEPALAQQTMPTVTQAPRAEPLRPAAWTLTGAGVATLGVGIGWILYVGTLDRRYQSDVSTGAYQYATPSRPDAGPDKASVDRKTLDLNKSIAWAVTGMGAAATACGLVWALWPHAKQPPVALAPWTSHGEVGLQAAMRF